MRHLMSSQSIMVIRLIFARRTLEFFIIKMYSPMIFEFQIRCKSFLANITFETIINRFMIFVDVNFEISHVKKWLVAVVASVYNRIAWMYAPMVFQLFCIFEAFLTQFASVFFHVRMDFHVCIIQAGENWCTEGAFCALVEFHVNFVLTPQMSVQCIPVEIYVSTFFFNTFGAEYTGFCGRCMAFLMKIQCILERESYGAIFVTAFIGKDALTFGRIIWENKMICTVLIYNLKQITRIVADERMII